MSDFKLPTTVGSIVVYTGYADLKKEEPLRYITTLIPSIIGDHGEFRDAAWRDSYAGMGDGDSVHPAYAILQGNPVVLFEAPEANLAGIAGEEPTANLGQVVMFDDPYDEGLKQVAVYAPGIIGQEGEGPDLSTIEECYWVNAYGSHTFSEIEQGNPIVLVLGTTEF